MKKVISIALALLMVAVMLPVMAAAADAEYDITDEAGLRAAVSAMAAGDNVTVRLQSDVTISGNLIVSTGTLTILGQGHTITFSHHSLVLSGTAILNLGTKAEEGKPKNDLILTSEDPTSCVVGAGGSSVLNMYHGVTIKDSIAGGQAGGVQVTDKATFNMHGGMIDNCMNLASVAGGVYIDCNGKFNMYDGIIQRCYGVLGGAVGLANAAPIFGGIPSGPAGFHMYGGTIKDCHDKSLGGGAVCAYTREPISFIMDGGTITGCSAEGNGYGGAIFIYTTHRDAVIEINKGEITGNTGVYGGGVFVYEGTVKIADGVALHNNTATEEGDDLYNESGSVTLGKLPTGLKLAACGCDIDGWYHDKKDARWSSTKCGGEADQMEKHTDTVFTDGRALKAAHGKKQAKPPYIVEPEDPVEEAPNPTTGANDFVGVAAAMAVVSLLGAAAVLRRK